MTVKCNEGLYRPSRVLRYIHVHVVYSSESLHDIHVGFIDDKHPVLIHISLLEVEKKRFDIVIQNHYICLYIKSWPRSDLSHRFHE